MIFNEINLCFVGVPKNASESVHETISSHIGCERVHDHVPMTHMRMELGTNRLQDMFCAAIKRNPYCRFASAYRYLVHNGEWALSIDETLDYLTAMMDEDPHTIYDEVNYVFHPQSMYIFDNTHKRLVDSLLSFENLTQDWESFTMQVEEHSGLLLPPSLRHVNSASNGKNWWDVLNTNQLMRLSKIYHHDFINLGYTKSFANIINRTRLGLPINDE